MTLYPQLLGTRTVREVDDEIEVRLDGPVAAPVATAASLVSISGFNANWNAVANAHYYLLTVASDAAFASVLSGYNRLPVTDLTYPVTGLSSDTPYWYKVEAVTSGRVSLASNLVTQTTLSGIFAEAQFNGAAGTLISAYAAEIGGPFVEVQVGGTPRLSNANRLWAPRPSPSAWDTTGVSSSANYRVQARLRHFGFGGNAMGAGIYGRKTGAATNRYLFWYNHNVATGTDRWELFAPSGILGFSNQILVVGNDYDMELRLDDDEITALIGGVAVIGPIVNSELTLSGKMGLRSFSDTADMSDVLGLHFDYLIGRPIT